MELQVVSEPDLHQIYHFVCQLEEEQLDFKTFKSIFLENVRSDDWRLYLIITEKKNVGYCSLHFKRSLHHAAEIAELEELFIDETQRSKGLGKLVINELVHICLQRGIPQLEVSTNKKREKAKRFYIAAGFTDSHHKLVMNA